MIKAEDLKSIGCFQRTHGLKGELNAIFDLDQEFLISGYPVIVEVNGIFVPFYVESVRSKGATTELIKLEGVDSEAEAKEFINKTIYGRTTDISGFLEVDSEELFENDELLDYTIFDVSFGNIGKVEAVEDSTSNVLLIVKAIDTEEKFYIPMVDEFIKTIDTANKVIEVEIPQELIKLNSTKPSDRLQKS